MATVSSMTEWLPTCVSVRRVLGPTVHSSPITVLPMSMTEGRMTVSRPILTSGPIHVEEGSIMVMPSVMWRALMRSRAMPVSSASCTRLFTPRPSRKSLQWKYVTALPARRRISSMSVR